MQQIVRDRAVARDMGSYDVHIHGGGLSGWAAAVSLAREGRSVLLSAPRTSLGHEIWAALSTWWPAELESPPLWQEIVSELERVNAARGTLLDAVAAQVALERAADEAGVELLLQVNAHPSEGDVTLLTGRWGLMAARSRVVIDATERGRLSVECGATSHARATDELIIRRALMVKTGLAHPERIEVGSDLPLAGGAVMAWTGLWPGDVILEAELDLPADYPTAMEMRSRRTMAEIAMRLRAAREEFAQGSLVHIALDSILPRRTVLDASDDSAAVARLQGDAGAVEVTCGMMLPAGTQHLIAASAALDLGEITARSCYYAPNAVSLGMAAAALAAEML